MFSRSPQTGRRSLAFVVAGAILIGTLLAIGSYQLGIRHAGSVSDTQQAPQTGRTVLYWHDPMVPGPKFDKPGKSPFMDMQLVPVYADETADTGVSVSPDFAQNLGMRTALVRKATMVSTVDAVGVVIRNELAASRATAWVMADVPPSQASQIHVGNEATVTAIGLATPLTGKLSAILPDVDPVTRTRKARIALPDPDALLHPGMFVRVAFQQSSPDAVLLIPQEAVIATGKRNVVIVAMAAGKYAPVEVQLGRDSGTDVEVRSGLTEGQKLVASGQFLLDSEANLQSGFQRLDTASGTPHQAE